MASPSHLRLAVISTHTCPLAPLGGWETGGMNVYVRELGLALARKGVQLDVFTRRQACDTPDVVDVAPGMRVIHLDAGPHRQVDKYEVLDYLPELACGMQRWRALTGQSYDLVHSHYWLSGRIGTLFSDRWNVPLVTMFHTLAEMKNRVAENAAEREQASRREIERRTMLGSDRVIAATEVDGAQIRHHYGEDALPPISIIPGGVDLAHFTPRDRASARADIGVEEARVVLFVGRIQRLKGIDVLLRAFELVHRRQSEDGGMRLLIVGGLPGDARPARRATHEAREIERLQRLAAKLGIAGQVTFVGAVQQDRLPLYYAAADLTVMPSSYESFGLVAAESLACGTPVVATRVGGLPSIVKDGETGILVPWRAPELFGDAIGRVLADDGLRRKMASNARASVQRLGWAAIAEQHLAVYEELIEERTERASAL